ncbi:unnamed protein product [Phytomonas sp. Hart1]|nr:unnamed protein product [Phytomonas sp. Hart1]|eukprot:CCW66085.1 unnamed protein product [Phytomonas sp. isolate Hart1]
MPHRQNRSAQIPITKKETHKGVDDFLGGFSVMAERNQSSHEQGVIAVNLRLMNKNSDITKQKSLTELILHVKEAPSGVLTQFVTGIAETVIRHSQNSNPTIRAFLFTLLKTLMERGKEVKLALVSTLPALSPVWIMSMNEQEPAVRMEAQTAFEATFKTEKQHQMMLRYKDDILSGILAVISDIVDKDGTPLLDDSLDRRSNLLFSALSGMGYMVKQINASQDAVMSFVLDNSSFERLLPTRPLPKGYMLAKTPFVRSSVLSLLRDMVSICPCTSKLHRLVAQAIHGSILEKDATIASRVWELLLFWFRINVSEVFKYIEPKFLDDVIDSFMSCDQQNLAEVIFPSLLPLLIQLTTEKCCEEMLDKFVGGLLKKMGQLKDLPNASANELELVFSALTECWVLYCIRKKGDTACEDATELFDRIMEYVSDILHNDFKRARYLKVVAPCLGLNLLKISHIERIYNACLRSLCEIPAYNPSIHPDTTLPASGSEIVIDRNWHLRPAVLESMYAKARSDPKYACQQSVLRDHLDLSIAPMLQSRANPAWVPKLLSKISKNGYQPSPKVAEGVICQLNNLMRTLEEREACRTANLDEAVADEGIIEDCRSLMETVLLWGIPSITDSLLAQSKYIHVDVVHQTIMEYHLKDPAKAFELLLKACRENAFGDMGNCISRLKVSDTGLTPEQRSTLLEAVVGALKGALRLVKGLEEGVNLEDDNCSKSDPEQTKGAQFSEKLNSRYKNSNEYLSVSNTSEEGADDDDKSSERGSPVDAGSTTIVPSGEDIISVENDLDAQNKANEVLHIAFLWCDQLSSVGVNDQPKVNETIGSLLRLSSDLFTEHLSELFYRIVAAISPRLYPEDYISIKALRIVLQNPQNIDDDSDTLTDALDEKIHFLKVKDFNLLVVHVAALLEELKVPQTDRDDFAWRFFIAVMKSEEPACYHAVHQLQFLVPFASEALLQRLVRFPNLWKMHCVSWKGSNDKKLASSFCSLFGGHFSLAELDLSLTAIVRTAQLLKLMDYSNCVSEWNKSGSDADMEIRTEIFYHLIVVASLTEVFPSGIRSILFSRLLPKALGHINALADLLIGCSLSTITKKEVCESMDPFVCTLAAALRDIAKNTDDHDHLTFTFQARQVMSAITERVIRKLFTKDGARGIDRDCCMFYTTFYAIMDETANVIEGNIFAQLPKDLEELFLEASCMLPSWDLDTAKLSLVIHRHLATMPVVTVSTVKSILDYAQRQNPLHCLELLAELSCTRIMDLNVFGDLVRIITHSLCRCYTLRHLPSNGRLLFESPERHAEPLPFHHLQRIAVAAVLARRGVILHSYMDDVLRSTVNLVVFDSICEAISRFRTTSGEEMPLLAKLIAFTSEFMSGLHHSDTSVLRASEASVTVIASALSYVYLWLNAMPLAKMEGIGHGVVSGVLCTICLVANLTLIRAHAPLHETMRLILNKWSLRPLRQEFSSTSPFKFSHFRRQNTLIGKTHKQKVLMFPYLLAWCVLLTTPATDEEASCQSDSQSYRQRKAEIYQLLDLLCVLLLTPLFSSAKRVEDTLLGAAASLMNDGDSTNAEAGVLGFEVVALTRVVSPQPMMQLARGAAAVFCLLLRGSTLSLVKGWLETVERKTQMMIYNFVQLYISPLLIHENLLTVLSHSPDGLTTFSIGESYSVCVRTAQKNIELSYTIEDARISVRIRFLPCYPLRQPVVEFSSGRECGISMEKQRMWMLKMTSLLFSETTNLWDCMELFRENVEAHLGGQEPCPICYAIVSAVNHKLPELQCSVCRNLSFHSSCLYKWWASGGQTVCPLCRSPWISE